MKKLALGILIGVVALALSGVATAMLIPAVEQAKSNAVAPDNSRVIEENEDGNWEIALPYTVDSDSPILKALFGVRHEFPNGFTANVTPVQLSLLNFLGIDIEPVQLYHILLPNKCGDGTCQGFESPETCPDDCGITECFPDNQRPWGIMKVNGGSGGTGIVAVLDTGVDQDHPDIVNNIVACRAFGYTTCEDGHGHGTHVAGTVLANGKIIGVAPATGLIAVKVCSNAGACWGDDIAAGIIYAADYGVNIISMSIGGDYPDSTIKSAIDYAVGKGVLLVAAAGNDGPSDGSIDYPGAFAEVVAVGATDSNDDVPDWSSRGIDDGDNSVISDGEVEFGAPGANVESTYNDGCYAYGSGTSMATPHVSGLASKLWQGSASETRAYLITITEDIYTTGYDTATGYGLPIAPAAPACSLDTDCPTGEICCSGQCIVPTCLIDSDCDDSNACTIDSCNFAGTCDATCGYTDITLCTDGDGCCPAGCDSATDSDCAEEDPCLNCFKGVCDGKCNPAKEDTTCPDCL